MCPLCLGSSEPVFSSPCRSKGPVSRDCIAGVAVPPHRFFEGARCVVWGLEKHSQGPQEVRNNEGPAPSLGRLTYASDPCDDTEVTGSELKLFQGINESRCRIVVVYAVSVALALKSSSLLF